MPELIWLSLTAVLYVRTSVPGVALAEALETVSPDRLTSMWQAPWSGHTLRELACRTLFVWERGYLSLDDTVIPKPFATAIEGLAWVYASQDRKPVYGLSLVLLVWTNGTVRIPLGMRWWHKGGASNYALALERLREARHHLGCRPQSGLFAAWYPAKTLLKRIRDEGWYVIGRLKKHRRCSGHPLRASRRPPYWAETGGWTGGLKVLVVRDGATDDAPNRLTRTAAEVRRLSRVRAHIEAVIRVCQDHLGFTGCQARSERAQRHHMACSLVAFCVLERERQDQQLSISQLKRQLRFKGRSSVLPALERLKSLA
jgi:DDE superfamily endonuclease